ncbi:SCO6745 family protein [Actinoplanes sp. NPDC049316]|uniref:SCO6745 family protein n=1 Tax=Actinoplanes sp. NPDC049316 TaxID=3154727 RepID=UPI003443CE2A
MSFARRIWQLYEPLHAVTYFAPQARAAFESAGLRGFWRGYFAGRAAPLGAVRAAPVTALFFTFTPGMVARALPDVWQRASPEQALAARLDGAVEALRAILPAEPALCAEAADLLEAAAAATVTDGRALGAANAALPRPAGDLARLWQAATVLREHRGDGHITALVAAGLTGCQALVLRDALHGGRDQLQPARGWTDAEWDATGRVLAGLGLLDADGRPTAAGQAAHRAVEDRTDALATQPWTVLDTGDRARLVQILTPLAHAAGAVIPYPNAVGVPRAGDGAIVTEDRG